MIAVPDRAELVLIGAEALGADPDVVLDTVDVGVLVGLEGRLRAATTVTEAVAEALVGIAASRPFAGGGRGNRVVAWLAAAHVAAANAAVVEIQPDEAAALVRHAEDGVLDERAMTAALAGHLRRSIGPVRRVVEALRAVLRPTGSAPPPVTACPLCGRFVDPCHLWLASPWQVVSADHAVSGCVRQHRAHGRDGTPFPRREDERTDVSTACSVVVGPEHAESRAFVALTERTVVAFRPVGREAAGVSYDLIPIDELAVSDLVGSWKRLWEREPVARVTVARHVASSSVVADLDWRAVTV